MIAANKTGYFPYTPGTNMLYGLVEAIDMLHEEGLENVFARHKRHGEATRRAVQAWGLEVQCEVACRISHRCSPRCACRTGTMPMSCAA